MALTLDEIILELYRLAETKRFGGESTDEALAAAIEGMEHLWTLRQADHRRNSAGNAKKQPRIWC